MNKLQVTSSTLLVYHHRTNCCYAAAAGRGHHHHQQCAKLTSLVTTATWLMFNLLLPAFTHIPWVVLCQLFSGGYSLVNYTRACSLIRARSLCFYHLLILPFFFTVEEQLLLLGYVCTGGAFGRVHLVDFAPDFDDFFQLQCLTTRLLMKNTIFYFLLFNFLMYLIAKKVVQRTRMFFQVKHSGEISGFPCIYQILNGLIRKHLSSLSAISTVVCFYSISST